MNAYHRIVATAVATVAATIAVTPSANAATPGTVQKGEVIGGDARISDEVAALAKARGIGVQDALRAYWTPERMMSARPASEIPAVKAAAAEAGKAGKAAETDGPAEPQGAPERIAGTGPTAAVVAPGIDQNVTPQSYFPNLPVGHPTARTNGKVFFTLAGLTYMCSASTLNTEGGAAVWTAGHCLSSGNGAWASDWCFYPNWAKGLAPPFGPWCAYQFWTNSNWFYSGNFDYDVGVALVGRQFGVCIVGLLGGQGLAWNHPVGQYVYAFGYPGLPPFDGQSLVAEQGSTYNGILLGDPGTIFMVNDMTPRSSGGPWLAWYDGSWGYINGVISFKQDAFPAYMFSPYFGNQVGELYNAVRYAGC